MNRDAACRLLGRAAQHLADELAEHPLRNGRIEDAAIFLFDEDAARVDRDVQAGYCDLADAKRPADEGIGFDASVGTCVTRSRTAEAAIKQRIGMAHSVGRIWINWPVWQDFGLLAFGVRTRRIFSQCQLCKPKLKPMDSRGGGFWSEAMSATSERGNRIVCAICVVGAVNQIG